MSKKGVKWNLPAKRAAILLWTFLVLSVRAFYITDYGDSVAVGNYVCRTDGQTFSLRLKENHTFHQVRTRNGVVAEADGTWRRFGEAHLAFSGGMLALPEQRLMPNGDGYATLEKTWGVWPYISLDSTSAAPIYRKSLFGFIH